MRICRTTGLLTLPALSRAVQVTAVLKIAAVKVNTRVAPPTVEGGPPPTEHVIEATPLPPASSAPLTVSATFVLFQPFAFCGGLWLAPIVGGVVSVGGGRQLPY